MKCSSIESVAFFHKRKVVYHIFPPEELKVLNNISKIGPVEFFNALMDSTEKSESSSLFTLEIFSAKDANAQSRRLFLLQVSLFF